MDACSHMDILIFENKKLIFKSLNIPTINDCFDRLIYLKKKFLELNLETFNTREIYAVVIREKDIEINEYCKHLSIDDFDFFPVTIEEEKELIQYYFESIINETSFERDIIDKHVAKILSKP